MKLLPNQNEAIAVAKIYAPEPKQFSAEPEN